MHLCSQDNALSNPDTVQPQVREKRNQDEGIEIARLERYDQEQKLLSKTQETQQRPNTSVELAGNQADDPASRGRFEMPDGGNRPTVRATLSSWRVHEKGSNAKSGERIQIRRPT